MKKTFTLLLLLSPFILFSQDFKKVDSIVSAYPKQIQSCSELAKRINSDFKSETEKSRAIFTWVATHIAYDTRKFAKQEKRRKSGRKIQSKKYRNEYRHEKKTARKTMNRRKGICGDYSVLYKHLCDLCRVECQVISGHSKTEAKNIGSPFGGRHGWNAVHINDQWHLLDVTWAAGNADTENHQFKFKFKPFYFFTDPEKFFLNHFPKDANCLFVDKSRDDFKELPLYTYRYLNSGIELISPQCGVIDLKKDEKIKIALKGIKKSDEVAYFFKYDESRTVVEPSIEGDVFSFEIGAKKRGISYLTIMVEYRAIATFKVRMY